MAATEPAAEPIGVYDGRDHIGNVERVADGYKATLPSGRGIGVFPSLREASRALSTATARSTDDRDDD